MPEFTNEIVELNELNRKVEANRQKKLRREKKLRSTTRILESIGLVLGLGSFVLLCCGVIPAWLGAIGCNAGAFCCVYVLGYSFGYEDAAV